MVRRINGRSKIGKSLRKKSEKEEGRMRDEG